MFDIINMLKTDNRIASSYFVKFIANRTRKTVNTKNNFWILDRLTDYWHYKSKLCERNRTFQNFFTFINLFSKI